MTCPVELSTQVALETTICLPIRLMEMPGKSNLKRKKLRRKKLRLMKVRKKRVYLIKMISKKFKLWKKRSRSK